MFLYPYQVTPSMQNHLQEVIAFKQFTIIAPTDSTFEAMSDANLEELTNNAEKRIDFLKKHILIGDVRNGNGANKAIGYSVSPNHSIVTMNKDKQRDVLVDAEDNLLQVLRSHPVYEGVVHIVKKVE